MDDKDASDTGTVSSNIQEVDVILSKCHDGVIVGREIEVLDEIPREGYRVVSEFHCAHVKTIQRPLREGIWWWIRRSKKVSNEITHRRRSYRDPGWCRMRNSRMCREW